MSTFGQKGKANNFFLVWSSQSPYLDALLVGMENNLVEILLCLSELSIDGPGSGDVTGIIMVFLLIFNKNFKTLLKEVRVITVDK